MCLLCAYIHICLLWAYIHICLLCAYIHMCLLCAYINPIIIIHYIYLQNIFLVIAKSVINAVQSMSKLCFLISTHKSIEIAQVGNTLA